MREYRLQRIGMAGGSEQIDPGVPFDQLPPEDQQTWRDVARAVEEIGREQGPDSWEVRDNFPDCTEHYVERGTKEAGTFVRAATIHIVGNEGYALACLIESALNMRDGTVD